MSMTANERRQVLLDHIMKAGSAQVDELATQFAVSRMTVHRDLDVLVEQGIVRKVHGGVTMHPSSLVESNLIYRSQLAAKEKAAIARAAAGYIEPGQAIILDDSSTVAALTYHLPALKPLTVITNSLGVIDRLKDAHGVKTLCLGGDYNARFNAFFGLLCEQAIASLRANTLFMSVSAVIGTMAYHQEEDVVKAKRALMAAVDRRILLVDSTKFAMTALNRLAGLSEFDLVITDEGVEPAQMAALRDEKINVVVAPL
ncbi:MAG: DeoR/GlpR transcriptional regulator [Rhodospirillaceae bacterium]|nr:MAG: DeoR/GlpR transcriptional regulator [Rhodospirillaceae bacterium]